MDINEEIEGARRTIDCYDDLTTAWKIHSPEIVIGALIAEIKQLKEAVGVE